MTKKKTKRRYITILYNDLFAIGKRWCFSEWTGFIGNSYEYQHNISRLVNGSCLHWIFNYADQIRYLMNLKRPDSFIGTTC